MILTDTCSSTDVLYCLGFYLAAELVIGWGYNVVAADDPSHAGAIDESVLVYTDSDHEHSHPFHVVRLRDDLIAARLQSVGYYESYQPRTGPDHVAREDLSSQDLERTGQVVGGPSEQSQRPDGLLDRVDIVVCAEGESHLGAGGVAYDRHPDTLWIHVEVSSDGVNVVENKLPVVSSLAGCVQHECQLDITNSTR